MMLSMIGIITPKLVAGSLMALFLLLALPVLIAMCVISIPVGVPYLVYDQCYRKTRLSHDECTGVASIAFFVLCTIYGLGIYWCVI